MPLVLARIDDRLIHGQVTVGWATHLKPHRILLANNEIAADAWQSQVYASSVSPEVQVSILSMAEATSFLNTPEAQAEKILLLTGSPAEMAGLANQGAPLEVVNVGGLHFGPGKKEMHPFVYLGQQDFRPLRQILNKGIRLSAQQVPGGLEHNIAETDLEKMEAKF
ncbi:MAG: PTS sugar transporter subunit IIB [bacterium]|nr:PTS sugar transporter subunit IIB [bacterium]